MMARMAVVLMCIGLAACNGYGARQAWVWFDPNDSCRLLVRIKPGKLLSGQDMFLATRIEGCKDNRASAGDPHDG